MAYRPTIGLEIHAELSTQTKMFCSCKNDPDEAEANVNICPICLAHPGTLPVPNRKAVEAVLKVGKALGGTLAGYSEFDRKSYFYPDIPKGYQISQYAYPFVSGGTLAGVAVTRVHLEEDTARSSHEGDASTSLVDFNRAGVPLMELVTEPVIHDAATASTFARELQLLLRALGASEANLEKGEMRIEANISVSATGELGTKVEVKNLNSFRSVERAIAYEVERQSAVLASGGTLVQETRGWDEAKQETFSQRVKEGSADYRYFPEPDLPKVVRTETLGWGDADLASALPELPEALRVRYIESGASAEAAEILVGEKAYARAYEEGILPIKDPEARKTALNILIGEVRSKDPSAEDLADLSRAFGPLMEYVVSGQLSSTNAKAAIVGTLGTGKDITTVIQENNLLQTNDIGVLREAVKEVIAANAPVAAEYKAGKEAALQYLLGQAMKATKGAGNPQELRKLFIEELG